MTYIDALASTPVNPPPLDDNGSTFWPPECHFGTWPQDFLFVAEVWVKYDDLTERRRIMEFRHTIICRTCGAELVAHSIASANTAALAHQRDEHAIPLDQRGPHAPLHRRGPFVSLAFDQKNALRAWQMLGFEDLWWEKPIGWRTILDGRNPASARYEADAIELGEHAATYWWVGHPQEEK